MRITFEFPDPLFARLKIQAAGKRVTLQEPLRQYVERGLNQPSTPIERQRSAQCFPCLEGAFATKTAELSNSSLFELLEQ
jgi:hypothetical protein